MPVISNLFIEMGDFNLEFPQANICATHQLAEDLQSLNKSVLSW